MLGTPIGSMKISGIFLMLTFMTSCAANECSWTKRIIVDEKDALVRATAEQIVAHNRKVERFCR
jgi:hypothetical protein